MTQPDNLEPMLTRPTRESTPPAYDGSGSAAPTETSAELTVHLGSRSGIRYASLRSTSTQRWRWLWTTSAVIIALVVAAIVSLTRSAPSPGGNPDGRAQAIAIDALLDMSTVGRGYLLTAIDDVNACDVTGSTLVYIRDAVIARRALLARINDAVVTDPQNGDEVNAYLTAAVQASLVADKAYLAWVVAAGDSCPVRAGATYVPVVAANAAADRAKRAFLGVWNRVARMYGLVQRSQTVI